MTSELNSGTLPEEELQKQSEVERKKRKRKDYAWAYAMIGPTILGLIILNIYPLLKSFYLSFTKSNGFGISTWTGLANYERLLADPAVYHATPNTLSCLYCNAMETAKIGRPCA